MHNLSTKQRESFASNGYVRVPGLADESSLGAICRQVSEQLGQRPLELEIDVGYPGAPTASSSRGASTPRRLLGAYSRGGALRDWASRPAAAISQLLNWRSVWMSQSHHNCVMTKYPSYSSDTLWHQDVRFWTFDPPRLVNCWLALGQEREQNGGLRVIPGSHRWCLDPDRLDQGKFLDQDHPLNASAIASSVQIDLDPGDALMFDAGLFHSASRNRTDAVKLSVVYTYHGPEVKPVAGSKSAELQEICFEP